MSMIYRVKKQSRFPTQVFFYLKHVCTRQTEPAAGGGASYQKTGLAQGVDTGLGEECLLDSQEEMVNFIQVLSSRAKPDSCMNIGLSQ